ncbi:enoyl-CoA hydratase-related protein [Paraconexibacter antarcticus]|uniref:Enoyl-CoA hydratase-related protein n=1 Tax=Paraconexibacter antarcticus TaxID=2949664 RepID=A0ABY5DRH3_9ACTN|nr:enoyl-CoA hydratase-related protein [Paraconexibacter antarcticus]UTI63509.1 enoyl-CoA hydratase-related protein [Paraconexibacter antarcticus]
MTETEVQTEALIAEGPVLVDLTGGVAHVRLNSPESSNGLDVPMLRALYEALMLVHGERRARAVLLSGEGRHFCAGGNVKVFASKGDGLPDYLREATSWLQVCSGALMRLQAPVVCAVQGFAAGGGGMGLVCASDLVVAGRSAKFMLGATRVGMAPDGGGSVTLSALVGLRKAMEIALTNPTIDAEEAVRIGLITRVVEDDEVHAAARALAEELAQGPTLALAATKRLLWDGLGSTVEARLPEEARTVSELSGTADALEGLAAVIERRPPTFTGQA